MLFGAFHKLGFNPHESANLHEYRFYLFVRFVFILEIATIQFNRSRRSQISHNDPINTLAKNNDICRNDFTRLKLLHELFIFVA